VIPDRTDNVALFEQTYVALAAVVGRSTRNSAVQTGPPRSSKYPAAPSGTAVVGHPSRAANGGLDPPDSTDLWCQAVLSIGLLASASRSLGCLDQR
jgi:hypothetical protein